MSKITAEIIEDIIYQIIETNENNYKELLSLKDERIKINKDIANAKDDTIKSLEEHVELLKKQNNKKFIWF